LIVRPRPSLLQLFFVRHGAILPRILPQILLFSGISAAVVLGHKTIPSIVPGHPPGPYALIGIALSIFFSFRNNACYERWWEARIQWGHLFLATRGLARQTLVLEPHAAAERQRILTLAMAFTQALVLHLRPSAPPEKVERHLTETDRASFRVGLNRPDTLARLIAGELARLQANGRLSDILYQVLDRSLGDMAAVQGACERIRNTPVPYIYNLLLQRTTYLFCLFLPLGFVGTLGWSTIIATALITYTFFGLDALGDELEQPFGVQPNHLPIGALADTIELELRDALGETPLPALPRPVDDLLM
jgi:putative membrane protein